MPASWLLATRAGSWTLNETEVLLPPVGLLPATDERMRVTHDLSERDRGVGGIVRRWPDDPTCFLIGMFWPAECLAVPAKIHRAAAGSPARPDLQRLRLFAAYAAVGLSSGDCACRYFNPRPDIPCRRS